MLKYKYTVAANSFTPFTLNYIFPFVLSASVLPACGLRAYWKAYSDPVGLESSETIEGKAVWKSTEKRRLVHLE